MAGDGLGAGEAPPDFSPRPNSSPSLAGRFATPTLVVLGGEDANVPQQITAGLCRWARVMVISGHGHGVGNAPGECTPAESYIPEMKRFIGHCTLR
jgi:hypothetical protein